ncbi:MAG TPA: Fe2+-dependent dioxygenase [Rhizomicrobium sp.]
MVVTLQNVLNAEELRTVSESLANAEWHAGAETAGWHAKTVKSNEQAHGPSIEAARKLVAGAISRHQRFRAAAQPKRLSSIMFSRYRPGMEYGTHIDDPLMSSPQGQIRTDLAVTVYLSEPDAYEGGGLAIPGAAENGVRLKPGDAVLYPATSLHRVLPVTSGERLAAIFWVQSLVRDADTREMLFDLDRARRLIFQRDGKSPAFDLVAKAHSNLLRKWAEI